MDFAPPAYVTGMEQCSPSKLTCTCTIFARTTRGSDLTHQLLFNTTLLAFYINPVNQKLGAVPAEGGDRITDTVEY